MCKLSATVFILAFCLNSYICKDQNSNKKEDDNSSSDFLKRLQQERRFPQFPDLSNFPVGQFPGLPAGDPNFAPLYNEEDIKKLRPSSNNEKVEAHFESVSSSKAYVDGKKILDKESGTILDNNNGNVTEKHYEN